MKASTVPCRPRWDVGAEDDPPRSRVGRRSTVAWPGRGGTSPSASSPGQRRGCGVAEPPALGVAAGTWGRPCKARAEVPRWEQVGAGQERGCGGGCCCCCIPGTGTFGCLKKEGREKLHLGSLTPRRVLLIQPHLVVLEWEGIDDAKQFFMALFFSFFFFKLKCFLIFF